MAAIATTTTGSLRRRHPGDAADCRKVLHNKHVQAGGAGLVCDTGDVQTRYVAPGSVFERLTYLADAQDYRLIAVRVGNLLKYDATINEINRVGGALFKFTRQSFPNDAITSQRAQLVHDWILTLGRQELGAEERNGLLVRFCTQIAPAQHKEAVQVILDENGIRAGSKEAWDFFARRNFHSQVVKHARSLFVQGNHFHAVFEACKAYNVEVRAKAKSLKDGQALMLEVWGSEKGVLKVTQCLTETDRNVQDGIKFLSAGLMQAMRNPTAHEPALDWPIAREDCLDILSFVSFLFRQLDKATYFKP